MPPSTLTILPVLGSTLDALLAVAIKTLALIHLHVVLFAGVDFRKVSDRLKMIMHRCGTRARGGMGRPSDVSFVTVSQPARLRKAPSARQMYGEEFMVPLV